MSVERSDHNQLGETKRRLADAAQSVYVTANERAALRCALGDAAGLCDALAKSLTGQHTVRGRITKKGFELAAIAKQCGDAIWSMRELVKVPRDGWRS